MLTTIGIDNVKLGQCGIAEAPPPITILSTSEPSSPERAQMQTDHKSRTSLINQ